MTKRGRPKGGAQLSRDSILAAAFKLLDDEGQQGLSMRGLASCLGVTPMALYRHFSDRSTLARGMSDVVYEKVVEDFNGGTGTPRRDIERLLILYYQSVVQYPDLTALIFTTSEEFSGALQKINEYLIELLAGTLLTRAKRISWLEILVDFTHGSALATAISRHPEEAFFKAQKSRYQRQIGELLDCIFE